MVESLSRQESAVVLFSGGQDSTTCLYWALQHFSHVEALTFDYGQRHRIELQSAQKIASFAGVPLTILPLNTFLSFGENALTSSTEVVLETPKDQLPNTFVPGRNLIFLTFAAAYAHTKQILHVVGGMCETDFSGYPDCRNETLQSLQTTLQLGLAFPLQIHTPLMWLNKAETVLLAQELGALEALQWSHTCYNGMVPPCQKCPACELRSKGFQQAGIQDPLVNQ